MNDLACCARLRDRLPRRQISGARGSLLVTLRLPRGFQKLEFLTRCDNIANTSCVVSLACTIRSSVGRLRLRVAWAGSIFYYIPKNLIEPLTIINVVNNALVLTGKNRGRSRITVRVASHFDASTARAVDPQRISTMHLFDRHWLSHTVNIHFPLHSLEVFMIAVQDKVQEAPSALNLIASAALRTLCNTFLIKYEEKWENSPWRDAGRVATL